MKIVDLRKDKNVHEDKIEDYLYSLQDDNKSFIVIEQDESDDNLNLDLNIALSLINATAVLQKVNRTLANLKLPNNLDQDILFEVITSVLRGDFPTVEQVQRYFALVTDIETYADKFSYINANTPLFFDYSIDLFLLGQSDLLTDSAIYAEKLDTFFNLRYSLLSKEIKFSEFLNKVNDLI